MGKGSQRRKTLITREAENLQWQLAYGKISFENYKKKRKQLEISGKWWKNEKNISNKKSKI